MNGRTACSNPPPGPVVKLTTPAGQRRPPRRRHVGTASLSQWRQILGGLFVWGRRVNGAQVHQINYGLMQRRPGLAWAGGAWPGLARGVMRLGVLPRPTVMTRALTTPVCAEGGGGRGVKSLHMARASVSHLGQSSHTHAHADELLRIVERRRGV